MKDTSPAVISAIREYQEPGAVSDFDETDFKQNGTGVEWSDHCPGTMFFPGGIVFLGMPKGFNKAQIAGTFETIKITMFASWENFLEAFRYGYNFLNIPVWKYKNENGHTFIRGLSPRTNYIFLHIILEDVMDKVDCLEITEEHLDQID